MATDPGAHLRYELVRTLQAKGAVRSAPVAAALSAVPREKFVPEGITCEEAYEDRALLLTRDDAGQPTSSISQPSMVALMLEQLGVLPGHRVLEIGTASGYNAALLSRLTGPAGGVATIEFDRDLAVHALGRLSGIESPVLVRAGDGWLGARDLAPFDRVVVTVGVDDLSPHWVEQLRDGGVVVAPVTLRPGLELSMALVRDGSELRSASVQPCGFVRLRGPHARPAGRIDLDGSAVLHADWAAEAETARLVAAFRAGAEDGGRVDDLPEGWTVPLALEASHPLVLTTLTPTLAMRPGLHDPVGGGLAVVDDERIRSYGDRGAARLLRDHLSRSEPLRATLLRITARPAGAPPPPGRWIVTTRHFSFAVSPG